MHFERKSLKQNFTISCSGEISTFSAGPTAKSAVGSGIDYAYAHHDSVEVSAE